VIDSSCLNANEPSRPPLDPIEREKKKFKKSEDGALDAAGLTHCTGQLVRLNCTSLLSPSNQAGGNSYVTHYDTEQALKHGRSGIIYELAGLANTVFLFMTASLKMRFLVPYRIVAIFEEIKQLKICLFTMGINHTSVSGSEFASIFFVGCYSISRH